MKQSSTSELSPADLHNLRKKVYVPPTIKANKKMILPDESELQQELLGISQNQQELHQLFTKFDFNELYQIFLQIFRFNGFIEVQSIGEFDSIVERVLKANDSSFLSLINPQSVEKLQQLFFTYEFTKKNLNYPKKLYEIGLVHFVRSEELRQAMFNKKQTLNYFNYDLTLFQKCAEDPLGYKHTVFNLEEMGRHYGNQYIDIRIQNPCDYGFITKRLKNKGYRMPLKDYRFYQMNFNEPEEMKNFPHLKELSPKQIFFGVNFEPHDNFLNREVKKCSENTFLDYHSDFDVLSYLDKEVCGCSIPQMYFKVPGCWTGGHQENVAMSALNINHGPGYSEWFTLDLKYVEQLRDKLNEGFGLDLYKSEGLWYEDLDWFILNGYPVKRFLQREDDVVVTGPGTLHWVRSFGVALQTSWNMMPKSLDQFKAAFHRQQKNKEVGFSKSNVIALNSIILKYLNHQRKTMDHQIRQFCYKKLKQRYEQEKQILLDKNPIIKVENQTQLRDNDSFCTICLQEIFQFYVPAPTSYRSGISCLECFFLSKKKQNIIKILYHKYDQYQLQNLFFLLDEGREYDTGQEITELCAGNHIGNVKCCKGKQPEKYRISEEDIVKEERDILHSNPKLYELMNFFEENETKTEGQQYNIIPTVCINTSCQTEPVKIVEIEENENEEGKQKKQKKKKKDKKEKKQKKQKKQKKEKKDKKKKNDKKSVSPVFSENSFISKSPVKAVKPNNSDNSSNCNYQQNSSFDADQGKNPRHKGFKLENNENQERGRGRGFRDFGDRNRDDREENRGRGRSGGWENRIRGRFDSGRGRGRGRGDGNERGERSQRGRGRGWNDREQGGNSNKWNNKNENSSQNEEDKAQKQFEAPDEY